MKRFIIGQYGGFDYAKYARDFRQGFYGIEACLFRGDEDISNLLKESRDAGFRVGIHFPLRDTDALRDALFMAQDETVRAREYARVQQALDELTEIAPDYVLFHYPKPVILDDRVNWGAWHFTDSSEYAYESSYPLELFLEQSEALFAWLSEQGRKYKFTPVLELDAINHYVYATDHVTRLLEKYSSIKLCLDTARLYLQDRLDPCFDALGAIRKFARFAGTVHLSNVQIGSNNQIANKRNPVLPNQHPDDGWAPIEAYLTLIKEAKPDIKIIFEHRSDLVTDEELAACYDWVGKLLGG